MSGSYPRALSPTRPGSGAPVEVGDLVLLALGELLRPRALVLRIRLALLEHALATRVRIAGEIPGGLLELATDLVRDSHAVLLPVGDADQAAASTSSTVMARRPGSGASPCGSPRPP